MKAMMGDYEFPSGNLTVGKVMPPEELAEACLVAMGEPKADEATPDFGPSILKVLWPHWLLREQLLKMTGGVARGHFTCDDLGDPKLNPPADDMATPVIVETDPPR